MRKLLRCSFKISSRNKKCKTSPFLCYVSSALACVSRFNFCEKLIIKLATAQLRARLMSLSENLVPLRNPHCRINLKLDAVPQPCMTGVIWTYVSIAVLMDSVCRIMGSHLPRDFSRLFVNIL